MVGKIKGGRKSRERDRNMNMDEGRNLKSQERIEVCSMGVETFFFSSSLFWGYKQEKAGKMGTYKAKFTG